MGRGNGEGEESYLEVGCLGVGGREHHADATRGTGYCMFTGSRQRPKLAGGVGWQSNCPRRMKSQARGASRPGKARLVADVVMLERKKKNCRPKNQKPTFGELENAKPFAARPRTPASGGTFVWLGEKSWRVSPGGRQRTPHPFSCCLPGTGSSHGSLEHWLHKHAPIHPARLQGSGVSRLLPL